MRKILGVFLAGAVVALFTLHVLPDAAQTNVAAAEPATAIQKTPAGKPNLTGVWQALNTAAWDIQDHVARPDIPAGIGVVEGNDIPYLPAAAKKKQENARNRAQLDPETKCYLPGVPRATYMPYPFQIVQSSDFIIIGYEFAHASRRIYLDGSAHPNSVDSWMGDSRARWEGDTLVVDVANFNDQTWFDRAGNFHSDALHVIERFTPISPNHLRYDVTIEDPKTFSRPWRMSMPLYRRMEEHPRILEYPCVAYLEEEEFGVPQR